MTWEAWELTKADDRADTDCGDDRRTDGGGAREWSIGDRTKCQNRNHDTTAMRAVEKCWAFERLMYMSHWDDESSAVVCAASVEIPGSMWRCIVCVGWQMCRWTPPAAWLVFDVTLSRWHWRSRLITLIGWERQRRRTVARRIGLEEPTVPAQICKPGCYIHSCSLRVQNKLVR